MADDLSAGAGPRGFQVSASVRDSPKDRPAALPRVRHWKRARCQGYEGRDVERGRERWHGVPRSAHRGAPTPGQQTLFSGGENPELLELVRQRLQLGPVSLEELRRWLLAETARWLPKHASQAVATLQDDSHISVFPPGRLTAKSVITLR